MLLSLLLSATPSASAFCGTYVGSAGATLYNHGSQVAIARLGHRTTLSLAMDYEGDLAQFALVVPVPEVLGPEDVRRIDPELFQVLDGYSAPRLVSYACGDWDTGWGGHDGSGGCSLGCGGSSSKDSAGGGGGGYAADEAPQVTVEAAFTEGEYDIVVLSAEESGDLYRWLGDNGYALPAGGEAILDAYIEAGSYFFAAKVSLDSVTSERVRLSPLQFAYDSEVFSLPVRIGTISAKDEQDLVIYTLTTDDDGMVGIANYPELFPEQECMWRGEGEFADFYAAQVAEAQEGLDRPGWVTEYSWSAGKCDPCSGEPPSDDHLDQLGFTRNGSRLQFTRLHMRYGPGQVDQDLTLYASGTNPQQQIRYITYKPELEEQFPICREGWAEEPGTCADAKGEPRAAGGGGAGAALPFAGLAFLLGALLGRRRG